MNVTIVKNPNWWETNQLANYKAGAGLEPGASRLQLRSP